MQFSKNKNNDCHFSITRQKLGERNKRNISSSSSYESSKWSILLVSEGIIQTSLYHRIITRRCQSNRSNSIETNRIDWSNRSNSTELIDQEHLHFFCWLVSIDFHWFNQSIQLIWSINSIEFEWFLLPIIKIFNCLQLSSRFLL